MMYRVLAGVAVSLALSSRTFAQSAPASIRAGDSVSGTLSATDSRASDGKPFRVYRFESEPGKRYFFNLHSRDFDAYLRIGKSIAGITDYVATDDDSGDGTDAQINLRSPDRSSYVIVVTSANDTAAKGGAYTLQVSERVDHPVSIRAMSVGDSVVGSLDANAATWRNTAFPYALYTFRAKKGQPLTARLRADSGTVDVTIGRISNNEFTSPAHTTVTSTAQFTPTEDGEYAVRIMASRPTPYVLHLNEYAPERVRVAQIGRQLTGVINPRPAGAPLPYEAWSLRADKNERLSILLTSPDFSTFLELDRRDADSLVRVATNAQGTASKIEVSAPLTGEYQIRIESANSSGGSYTLRVDTLARIERQVRRSTIAGGQEIRSTLSETDSTLDDGSPFQEWTYQVKQPKERVVFTMRSQLFDTFLSVGRMEGGRFVEFSSNDDAPGDTTNNHVSRVMIVAPAPGTFVIRANSMAINQHGAYTLRAGPPETEDQIARAINIAIRAQSLARRSLLARAIATMDSALAMDSSHVTNDQLNTVCWFGSLQNFASRVLSYCERAVRLDPTDNSIRDSRGVARALAGNVAGAIDDFRAFSGDASKDAAARNQRRGWLDALQRGTAPQEVFSAVVRAELLKQ